MMSLRKAISKWATESSVSILGRCRAAVKGLACLLAVFGIAPLEALCYFKGLVVVESYFPGLRNDVFPSPLPLLILLAAAFAVLRPPLWSGGDFLYSKIEGPFSEYLFWVTESSSFKTLATPGNPALFLCSRPPVFDEVWDTVWGAVYLIGLGETILA